MAILLNLVKSTISLVQETEHDMDTDRDTIRDNSDTDMSDSDN